MKHDSQTLSHDCRPIEEVISHDVLLQLISSVLCSCSESIRRPTLLEQLFKKLNNPVYKGHRSTLFKNLDNVVKTVFKFLNNHV